MNTKTFPPSKSSQEIRLTIPVSVEVYARFKRYADIAGVAVGRAMSDWLRDTGEGVDVMTTVLEEHKKAPKLAMKGLIEFASTLRNMTDDAIIQMKKGPLPGGGALAPTAAEVAKPRQAVQIPPPCNTGGKLPRVNPKKTGGKSL